MYSLYSWKWSEVQRVIPKLHIWQSCYIGITLCEEATALVIIQMSNIFKLQVYIRQVQFL